MSHVTLALKTDVRCSSRRHFPALTVVTNWATFGFECAADIVLAKDEVAGVSLELFEIVWVDRVQ